MKTAWGLHIFKVYIQIADEAFWIRHNAATDQHGAHVPPTRLN